MLPVALGLPYLKVPRSNVKHRRLVMYKNKHKAVSILLPLGGILVLLATWDFRESQSPQIK
jgi:hypothetical protein